MQGSTRHLSQSHQVQQDAAGPDAWVASGEGSAPSRLAAAAGIGFGVLVLLDGAATGHPPMPDKPAAAILRWYAAHRGGTFAMELVLALAGLFLLWFVVDLRRVAATKSQRSALASGYLIATSAAAAAIFVAGGWAQSALAIAAGRPGEAPPATTIHLLSDLTWLRWAGLTLVIGAAATSLAVLALDGLLGARWVGWVAVISALLCAVGGVAAYFPGHSGRLSSLSVLGYLGFVVFGISVVLGGTTLLLQGRRGARP